MPPVLLAIDTATEVCSVAVALGAQVEERAETVGHGHSERVLPMVHALLQDTGRRLADCDAIAFGAGPGAFTGLRIACGVAQGLAYGAGKPVVPVGNLAALAWAAAEASPGARRILSAVDARMQEVYWAVYRLDDDGLLSEEAAPALAAGEELGPICRRYAPDLVAGNALLALGERAEGLGCRLAPDARASARGVACLAVRAFVAGGAIAAASAAPVYVRDRVALTIEERRAAAGRP